MVSKTKFTVFFVLSGVFLILGILFAILRDHIFSEVFRQSMVLSPTSSSVDFWKDIPFPLEIKAYLWNVSNPEDVQKGLAKPKLTEVGPFIFKEYRNKTGIVWNHANGTVSYKQSRYWVFNPEGSLPLDTLVTIINVPAAAVTKSLLKLSPILWPGASLFLMSIREKLFVTQRAVDILFRGYPDPLLKFASKYDPLPGVQDKFAIFYKRNNSAKFDGVFNIHTGESGLGEFGEVSEWNYNKSTGYFPSPCGDLKGGVDFLPPFEGDEKEIAIYSTDLCRPLLLELTNKTSKFRNRLSVYEYKLNSSVFYGNSSIHPENACFEGGHPLPSGVFNASACRLGAPVFISNPHFLGGDSFYSSQFSDGSMNPNASLHQSKLQIEPLTGLLMEVHIKSQFNVFLQHVPVVDLFNNVKSTFFPVAWFDYSMKMGLDMTLKVWVLSCIPFIFIILGLTMLGIGLGNFVLGGIYLRAALAQQQGDDRNRLFIDDEISQGNVEEVSDQLVDRS